MGNKQEPAKSLRFHHGARHCVNVQSDVRKVLAFALYFSVETCKMASKTNGQSVSVCFITNWNFEMLAALYHPQFCFSRCFWVVSRELGWRNYVRSSTLGAPPASIRSTRVSRMLWWGRGYLSILQCSSSHHTGAKDHQIQMTYYNQYKP